jgi:hypothetical protein
MMSWPPDEPSIAVKRAESHSVFFAGLLNLSAMNARAVLFSLAACLAASGLGGCGSPSAETGRNKAPVIVMKLDPDVTRAVATVHIGDEVKFVLPATRGPGFVWQIVSNDPRSLRQSSAVVFTPGASDAAGTAATSFIAQRPSRSFIRFAYVPVTGGKETELVDAYEILVTVQN